MLALILWVATAAAGLLEIVVVREMLLRISARFWGHSGTRGYWSSVNLGNWAVFALALLYIVFVVGGGEYHYRRVGQRSSWKLFG